MRQWMWVLGVLAAVSGLAGGQVYRTQDGRALDSNYRVGSGGYNSPTGDANAINSQYYITGQVTGLGAFRGGVPYRAADQLRLDVPSAAFAPFRAQSVGVSQVMGGPSYGTSAYLDPSSTVFGVRGIEAGLNVPGSNAPVTPVLAPPVANRLYREATEAYEPLLSPAPGRVTAVEATGYAPSVPSPASVPEGTIASNLPVWQPATAGLFGVPRPEEAEGLVRELRDLAKEEQDVASEKTLGGWFVPPSGEDAEAETPETQELREGTRGGWVRQPGETPPAEAPINEEDPMSPGPMPEAGAIPEYADVVPGAAASAPQADRDVFTDLLVRMGQMRSGQREDDAAETEQDAESLQGLFGRPAMGAGQLVEVVSSGVVLHALAGKNQDRFNRLMADGEKLLRTGKYYEAAEKYELAAVLAPNNPLARVGAGLAYFSAGEPVSAGVEFRKALQLFPPLMETQVDLARMLPEGIVAERLEQFALSEKVRTDLRARMLALVVTFMRRNIGDAEGAVQAAQRLSQIASDDALLAAYAEYVLTGRRPSEAAATQPTQP